MKVIDEKGRIFGRVNIIDLLVLIVVAFVAAILVGKMLSSGGGGLGGSAKLTYTVRVYDVEQEVYESIQGLNFALEPDQLMASGDLLNGYVIGMTAEPSQGQVFGVTPDVQGGMEVSTKATNTYDLTFMVEAHVANNAKNELGTQEIRVGKTHILKTTKFELEKGIILSLAREVVE